MFTNFFLTLRDHDIPVSLREYLTLLEAMQAGVANYSVDDFYYLSRTTLIKNESNLDKFDQIFGHCFKGLEAPDFKGLAAPADENMLAEIPEEWLRKLAEKFLSPEEMSKIDAVGDWDKLMETLKKRLEQQKARHQGGSKWIGTAGTSPFGAYGYNPEGIRIGQNDSRHHRAVKVWDKREFRNLDDNIELGTRNIKVALKRLRNFARQGGAEELDLDDTIRATAKQGYLDIKMVPERRNTIKVLIFFDIGGSMDPHIKLCEELFSAARSEFKHMEYFYFHNCLYEGVWQDNRRRHHNRIATYDILHKYPHDYKVIFVGDATMSPYEIVYPGGSVEHWNEESGDVWMKRILAIYQSAIWLNPTPEVNWNYSHSISLMRQLMAERMYPLTVSGLEMAMKDLSRKP